MARRLQQRLALAQFKTKHGWEDLTFDTLEPRYEEEIRRKRLSDGDLLSDSSSSASDLPSYPTRTLMSSPLKAPLFSDALGSSGGSGHRKRNYVASFDMAADLSPSKRLRSSPTAHRSFSTTHQAWKEHHQLAQSSPIKPRRQQHFTTSSGPNVSFFPGTHRMVDELSPNYAAASDEDSEDLLPAHSFRPTQDSPPSTPPPMRNSGGHSRRNKDKALSGTANGNDVRAQGGEEGADLLLYLAASPSPANPNPILPAGGRSARMQAPSTPPQKSSLLALPSSMMTTPGGGNLNLFSSTPGQAGFDFSDFVNMTPSPAQKPWKTPNLRGTALGGGRTPLSVARRRLTFDD
jgi:hypothetical protein